MKSVAAIGVGMVIAAAAALWFATGPVVVTSEIRPLPVNPSLPVFKQVPSKFDGK
ncbi:hypothetical protein [Bradyrhizobium sp. BR13661]|jgi:hypothetical protein|uniref:hypothetical protein n=1 Tax=Bradyrhizobium sp. BR13661 TaxID=2940622 RepID=UPI0024770FAA|nr:hypothetical protein [Bradyrhizobium sp. BR13661]MDH6258841.1 hypothetical protein [Bradyrhizobium sp. BR13661]